VLTAVQLQARLAVLRQPPREVGVWLAERMQSLGPAYIKLGQFISARRDVYGDDFAAAFGAMHCNVTPVVGDEAEAMLRSCVDVQHFDRISSQPLAAASIAQVHRARLKGSNRRVVIKVVRPNVRSEVAWDMGLLKNTVDTCRSASALVGMPAGVQAALKQASSSVHDFAVYLGEEMDLSREVRSLQQFCKMYPPDHPRVRVPRLVLSECRDGAVVMDDVPSRPLSSIEGVAERVRVARELMLVFIDQLMSGEGLLHGDPHSGNVGIDREGRFVLYDFGSIIKIEPRDMLALKDLVLALVLNNPRAALAALRRMNADILDEAAVLTAIQQFRIYMRDLDALRLVQAAQQAQAQAQAQTQTQTGSSGAHTQMPIVLPPVLSRIARTFALLEGMCKDLDPTFNYIDTILAAPSTGGAMLAKLVQPLVADSDYISHRAKIDVDVFMTSISGQERDILQSAARAISAHLDRSY
jgi:predicted unusual protein kinase regulating ubiquinone biosynthesis (AarF/ABC1/UbiB family)